MFSAPGPKDGSGTVRPRLLRKKPAPNDKALRGLGKGFKTALYQKINCRSSGILRITST